MPQTPHIEKHFTSGEVVRDIVIGMSDGLTVPFALAAGLSGAIASTSIIVTAGLAEIVAGSIAMGLGGYLAGKSDAEHYESEYQREIHEIDKMLQHEKDEVLKILETYGLTTEESTPIVDSLAARPKDFADFMMRFELGLEKPQPKRAFQSGLTIGGAYAFGGLIPLLPYFVEQSAVGLALVSRRDGDRAVRFRLHQRKIHRCATFQKCNSNLFYRKCRGRRSVSDRQTYQRIKVKKLV